MIITVASEPRLEGERKPSTANTTGQSYQHPVLLSIFALDYHLPSVTAVMAISCVPLPTSTDKSIGRGGARKTSP